jgi:hypothetical protein
VDGLAIKSVCRDTALLYLTLKESGPLPGYLTGSPAPDTNQAIAELVLDGVLEIKREGDNEFVSGSNAYPLLYADRPTERTGGALARLSVDALRYAQALEIDDAGKLSARLYFYNRQPASPRWLRDLPDEAAVAEWIGLGQDGPLVRKMRQSWSELAPPVPSDGWRVWRRRTESLARKGKTDYKLYVSPLASAMPDAFGRIVEVIGASEAVRFKVGRDVYGLLRPDKLVAYFPSFEAVSEAAESLRDALPGCQPHGVPFTAELTPDGLISWGMDPPRDRRILGWQEFESWRLWLTNRLATSLVAARSTVTGSIEPWRFAMERMELQGVDTTTWVPSQAIWGDGRPQHSQRSQDR